MRINETEFVPIRTSSVICYQQDCFRVVVHSEARFCQTYCFLPLFLKVVQLPPLQLFVKHKVICIQDGSYGGVLEK